MPSRCRGGIAEERRRPQPMMNGMEKSDLLFGAGVQRRSAREPIEVV